VPKVVSLDFALILVVLTAATGVIWAIDALFFSKARFGAVAKGGEAKEPVVVEYAKSFFPILLLVLLIRSFLFEPFRIPSASMMPTLLEGDFIFVNKFAYGLRLPVLNTKIVQFGEPQHGDVVVFRLPSDPSVNYIKRVVGLPGDVVEYDSHLRHIILNGKPVPIELKGEYDGDPNVELGREQLGNHDHGLLLILNSPSRGGKYQVPPGHYFMMGDNRDNSQDSRFSQVEFVPEANLVGRAVGIWMNWRWPAEGGPQWKRIGKGIE
jgi:signal peptidase I